MKKGPKMDNRIGNGTMLVTCSNCGKSLLSGQLMRHMQSKECRETGEKKRTREEVSDLRKRVVKLEEEEKKK